ncbi:hypothetical protein, partial [Pantoea septica]|uniref:hypothetical protein n=1 Tax=Pantoea septica TaxID=472695 RepID=UPI0028ABF428
MLYKIKSGAEIFYPCAEVALLLIPGGLSGRRHSRRSAAGIGYGRRFLNSSANSRRAGLLGSGIRHGCLRLGLRIGGSACHSWLIGGLSGRVRGRAPLCGLLHCRRIRRRGENRRLRGGSVGRCRLIRRLCGGSIR